MNVTIKPGEVRAFTVLIDTWWNVNMYLKKELRLNAGVLIDTWWNVNSKAV